MKELIYQKKHIAKLVSTSLEYLQEDDSKLIVFHAPTGAGKTVMLAEALSQLVKSEDNKKI